MSEADFQALTGQLFTAAATWFRNKDLDALNALIAEARRARRGETILSNALEIAQRNSEVIKALVFN